ncbi:GNAT family N-acetyltransferase [Chryseobacterium phosphatilyticum]|uniref:GNAT family N-acetyltransferase n=1 Tax=Chryseobacterium phosphatilyticum TaxID=475075 RepID=A0A316X3Z4_9FLAO|nr:GNAT family N-acetyltransferase [Chryseobacterium phosphatilyticum]PWN68327.1 GNAT family N-acetyltransferase [Chryseobacterium phosphatilyticum]
MYNVLIRPLVKEDALTSYHWRNDPEVWKFTGSRPDREITQEIESEWIDRILKDEKSKRFAILCDNQYVGNVQLTNIENTTAEFHIFIGNKNFWGKGISQLATYQILYYAKEVLKLSEINLHVKPENIAAVKSYKRNNFVVIEENSDDIKMSLQLCELKNPTVSIFVMVYNHAQFLKDCLDSLLEQKTNFNYDIVVGEDCSKDNSREILLGYQNLYPGKFKLLLHPNNIGAIDNQNTIYENCSGKYIAICEGDDYWINPLKLQKQVDFLERNPEYSLSFHKIKELTTKEEKFTYSNPNEEKTYTLEDLSKENFIITVSVLFRKNFEKLPEWMKYSPIGDYPLHLLNASYGLIKYFPEEMAVYRVGSGIWSTQNTVDQIINTMFSLKFLLHHFKSAKEVSDNLKVQYTNFQKALLRPFDEKRSLEIKVKDYNYLESITSFSYLLKMLNIKLLKKMRLKK